MQAFGVGLIGAGLGNRRLLLLTDLGRCGCLTCWVRVEVCAEAVPTAIARAKSIALTDDLILILLRQQFSSALTLKRLLHAL